MLFDSTIHPQSLQSLKELQQIDFLKDFILVGGTSLALQIGHRISIDLDLFAFSDMEVSAIPDHISRFALVEY